MLLAPPRSLSPLILHWGSVVFSYLDGFRCSLCYVPPFYSSVLSWFVLISFENYRFCLSCLFSFLACAYHRPFFICASCPSPTPITTSLSPFLPLFSTNHPLSTTLERTPLFLHVPFLSIWCSSVVFVLTYIFYDSISYQKLLYLSMFTKLVGPEEHLSSTSSSHYPPKNVCIQVVH